MPARERPWEEDKPATMSMLSVAMGALRQGRTAGLFVQQLRAFAAAAEAAPAVASGEYPYDVERVLEPPRAC